MPEEQLTVKQTATGYWVVEQGAVQLSGAPTREAAEAERELKSRLRDRTSDRHSPLRPRARARKPPAR